MCQCNQKCKDKQLCSSDNDCGEDGKCTWQCVIGEFCNKLPGSCNCNRQCQCNNINWENLFFSQNYSHSIHISFNWHILLYLYPLTPHLYPYSSNRIRKTQNEHLYIVCQNWTVSSFEFNAILLLFWFIPLACWG